jgi:hypothetical protein
MRGPVRSLADGPGSRIGRHPAQIIARRELAKLAAVPLWLRILRDIAHALGDTGNSIPAGWFGLIVIAVLVLGLIVVILTWVRPRRAKRRARASGALGALTRGARDYRADAERLAAEGKFARAIIEGVRAIAAELDERGILPPRPGRTANELALEAGRELPALAADLRAVTRLFDDVRYGDRAGSAAGYDLVRRVDAEARKTEATRTGITRTGTGHTGAPELNGTPGPGGIPDPGRLEVPR